MLVITKKIKEFLEEKNISQNNFAISVNLPSGAFSSMLSGDAPFPDDKIQKIAPVLEVSPEEIKGWILADKYPENILKRALEVKQEVKPEAKKLILTIKIDSLLQQRGLSRTALSGLIEYSQGKLNQMIKGDEPISPLVISKIAPVLEVSEDEITSWIVADKHSVEALRVALES